MRRITFLLIVVFVALIFFFIGRQRSEEDKEGKSVSEILDDRGYIAVGEAAVTGDTLSRTVSGPSLRRTVSGQEGVVGYYDGMREISYALHPEDEIDLTSGFAAVELSQVERTKRVFAARAAMEQRAFFTGTTKNVDYYLRKYGEGNWYGIRDVSDGLVIFYEGIHLAAGSYISGDDKEPKMKTREIPFKVSFTVYEDGSFVVREITENDEAVDDWVKWMGDVVRD